MGIYALQRIVVPKPGEGSGQQGSGQKAEGS